MKNRNCFLSDLVGCVITLVTQTTAVTWVLWNGPTPMAMVLKMGSLCFLTGLNSSNGFGSKRGASASESL
jgi:hypothetical protein